MTWNTSRSIFLSALAVLALAIVSARQAHSAPMNSVIPVSGTFSGSLGGSGQVHLTSASGTYRTWIGFTHTSTSVSAGAQTRNLNVGNTGLTNAPASGVADLDYDNITPGTPQFLNSLNADLNGAGGSNQNIPLSISTASPLNLSSPSNTDLALAFNGIISDLTFESSAGTTANPAYGIPGDFHAVISGPVTGTLTRILGINSNVGLGTVYTIPPTPITFPGLLPGTVTLSDLQGGAPPFPNDMLANFAGSDPGPIAVPVNLPLNVAYSATVPNGQSGFSVLNITGSMALNLNLSNLSYSLDGVVQDALVPEPGTFALAGLGLIGLVGLAIRRRRG